MQGVRDVLDFWFGEEARARWFDPTPGFDQTIRRRFGRLYARAATGELDAWQGSAEGCLALCVLLDQMPRNMFRGDPRAFATDARARRVAEHAIAHGFDRQLPDERRQFLYLPFQHSETVADQLRSLALFESLGSKEGRRYAEEHLEVIRRFGRFPHRNAVLGRESTPEETEFLRELEQSGAGSWMKPPAHNRVQRPPQQDGEGRPADEKKPEQTELAEDRRE